MKSLEYKPKGDSWTPPEDLQDNLKLMAEYIDPRKEEGEADPETVLTDDQEQELRAMMTKTDKRDD